MGSERHPDQHGEHAGQPQPQEEPEKPHEMAVAENRQDQSDETDHQRREDQLLAERHRRRELRFVGPLGVPNLGQQLACHLDEALRPPALLDPEVGQVLRQLAHNVRLHQKHPSPPLEMGPKHQIEILRQGVVRPATRRLDGGAAPDAARAVELEGHAAAGAHLLLDGKMGVLHQPLRSGEPAALAVAPFDAGLHEGRLRMGQHCRHGAAQPVGWRHEVGVENGDVGRIAQRHAGSERARLEAGPIGSPDMVDVHTLLAQPGHGVDRNVGREIGTVVEQLDLQEFARPVEPAGRHDGTLHDHGLVVDRDLNQHARQIGGQLGQRRVILRRLGQPVEKVEVVGRQGELHGQAQHHDQIGEQQQHRRLSGSGSALRSSGRPRCGGGGSPRRRCVRRGSTARRRTWRALQGP